MCLILFLVLSVFVHKVTAYTNTHIRSHAPHRTSLPPISPTRYFLFLPHVRFRCAFMADQSDSIRPQTFMKCIPTDCGTAGVFERRRCSSCSQKQHSLSPLAQANNSSCCRAKASAQDNRKWCHGPLANSPHSTHRLPGSVYGQQQTPVHC